jgi:uncharacterized protein (DUF488 family)
MNRIKLYTLGVYGTTAAEFFRKLLDNRIDVFCDIRARRAVRGADYAFANAARLEAKLEELKIAYIPVKELATPPDIQKRQRKIDAEAGVGQRQREQLSPAFAAAYTKAVLESFDFDQLVQRLKELRARRVALFCVEKFPAACHRSLVAERLHALYGYSIVHL